MNETKSSSGISNKPLDIGDDEDCCDDPDLRDEVYDLVQCKNCMTVLTTHNLEVVKEKREKVMGLKDLTPGDDENQSDSGGSGGGTGKKYVRPTREDMDEFFNSRPEDWTTVSPENTKEIVYETNDFLFLTPNTVLRVFSTVDERTDVARDKGSDAIRTVVWDRSIDRPIGGRTKTLRISSWRKNLGQKIDDLMANQSQYVQRCPKCNDFMVIRSGKYGEFYGCRNYPDCSETAQIED